MSEIRVRGKIFNSLSEAYRYGGIDISKAFGWADTNKEGLGYEYLHGKFPELMTNDNKVKEKLPKDWQKVIPPRAFIPAVRHLWQCSIGDEGEENWNVVLLKVFMQGDDLVVGLWDDVGYSDIYYGDNEYVDLGLEMVLDYLGKAGISVGEMYILTKGKIKDVIVKKNNSGEYTMVVY